MKNLLIGKAFCFFVGVQEEPELGVALLPPVTPSALLREFRWPILALAEDHSMAFLELLEWSVHIDGVGVVPALLSGGGRLALAVDAPGQETLEFRDLMLGNTDWVLHHAPVVHREAGWDSH